MLDIQAFRAYRIRQTEHDRAQVTLITHLRELELESSTQVRKLTAELAKVQSDLLTAMAAAPAGADSIAKLQQEQMVSVAKFEAEQNVLALALERKQEELTALNSEFSKFKAGVDAREREFEAEFKLLDNSIPQEVVPQTSQPEQVVFSAPYPLTIPYGSVDLRPIEGTVLWINASGQVTEHGQLVELLVSEDTVYGKAQANATTTPSFWSSPGDRLAWFPIEESTYQARRLKADRIVVSTPTPTPTLVEPVVEAPEPGALPFEVVTEPIAEPIAEPTLVTEAPVEVAPVEVAPVEVAESSEVEPVLEEPEETAPVAEERVVEDNAETLVEVVTAELELVQESKAETPAEAPVETPVEMLQNEPPVIAEVIAQEPSVVAEEVAAEVAPEVAPEVVVDTEVAV